jgi:putative oxidoreductase
MMAALDSFRPNAHWVLRAGLASVFLFHGVGKAVSIEGFSRMMEVPYGIAALVTFAELAAGIGIILGGFKSELITRLATIAMIPVLLGAIFMAHWGRWSFTPAEGFPMGGMEFQFVLLMSAIYFLIVGNSTTAQSA